ncbi:uncharacterized [Tachysurus ichikawai]
MVRIGCGWNNTGCISDVKLEILIEMACHNEQPTSLTLLSTSTTFSTTPCKDSVLLSPSSPGPCKEEREKQVELVLQTARPFYGAVPFLPPDWCTGPHIVSAILWKGTTLPS